MRSIAAEAGVSAALIVHHFGSKERLREACDEQVLRVIREAKAEAVGTQDPTTMLGMLARPEEYADVVAYVLHSLRAGGTLAAAFVQHMIDDAELYLAVAVEAGTMKPSRDPAARARWLVYMSLGSLLVHATVSGARGEAADPASLLRSVQDATLLPGLEVFTEGLLTDRVIFDAYLDYLAVPPDGSAFAPDSASTAKPNAPREGS